MPLDGSSVAPAAEYVGRIQEISDLEDRLRSAVGGRGSLMLLSGEPGIGKTRTCDKLAAEAQRLAMIVAWGRCWEGHGASQYWPWVQIVRQLMMAVPSERLAEWTRCHSATVAALLPDGRRTNAVGAPQDRFQLYQGVLDIVHWATQSAPLLLVIDDLQGADEGSLLLLDFVARDIAAAPVFIVCTYREVAAASGSPLATRLPELTRQATVSSLTLRPFDLGEVESFVDGGAFPAIEPATVAKLHQLTEGNPLLLLECLRAVGSEANVDKLAGGEAAMPAGVRTAVRRHLAPLSSDCRAILRAAAVVGREFGIAHLRELLGYADEMLLTAHIDEAIHIGIVAADPSTPGRCRFVHQLVRDGLYAELSNVELLRYHHDAGTTLAARLDRDANLAQITHHFLAAARRGANPEPAVSWAHRAGDCAFGRSAYADALRFYDTAIDVLEHFGPDDPLLHAELLHDRGSACNRLGEIDRAKQSFRRAAELARRLGSAELLARAALGYGGPLPFPEGGYVDAEHVALLEEALGRCADKRHGVRARLLSRLASAIYFSDQGRRRRELCDEALRIARACGDPDALGHVLLATHAALWGPDPAQRLALVDELLHLIARTGDRSLAFAAHHWRYCDLLELGDVAGMENEFQACRALAQELREPAMLGWVDIFRAGRAMWQGRFQECERLATDTAAMAQWLGNAAQTIYFLQIYHLRSLQGRGDEMLEPMRMIAGLNPAIPAFGIGLAHIHVEAGRIEEARLLAADIVAHLEHYPVDVNYVSTLTCLGLVCARIGDASLTQPVYDLVRPYEKLSIMIGNGLGYCGPAAHWLGVMAASLGRLGEAAAHFERALASEAVMGSPPWLANTQYEYADMLYARGDEGDRARAAALAADAAATSERLDMAALHRQALALASKLPAARKSTEQAVRVDRAAIANAISVYRREGEFWTIEHDGRILRMRDSRGLRYLAQLLQHPNREFLVVDLAVDVSPAESAAPSKEFVNGANCCGAEAVADRRAVAQYRSRLEELRADLCEAEANNDLGRIDQLRGEMEALEEQLTGAVGLGGRQRTVSSDLERARSAVTKRIRDTVRRIQEEYPELGHHLARTVQTGYVCTYSPAPHEVIRWSF
jgi:tetratricopeptide (TPR) repeat protein